MSWAEVVGVLGAAVSGLFSLVVILIGVVYRNDERTRTSDKAALEAKITALEGRAAALEKQNLEQETKLATIIANATNHNAAIDKLTSTIDRLDNKVDEFTRVLGQIVTMLPRGGYSPRMTPPPGSQGHGG